MTGQTICQKYINNAFFEMLGVSREDRKIYKGEDFLTVVHPEDLEHIRAAIAKLMAGEERITVNYRVHIPDGSWFWIRMVGSVVNRKDNFIRGYVTFSDYNEVMQAQKTLESGQITLRTALQSAKILTWRYDYRKSCIIDSLTLGEKYHMPKVIDNIPDSVIENGYIAEECIHEFRNMFCEMPNDKTVYMDTKTTIQDDRGRVVWYRQIYTPMFDAYGNYVESVAVAIDITEQKYKEQRYEEQIHLNNVTMKNEISKVSINLSRNQIYQLESNDTKFKKLSRYKTADELLGSTSEMITDEIERAKFEQVADCRTMIEAFQKGVTHIEITCHVDVNTRWARVTYDMIENPYTGDIEMVSSIHDVTDMVRAELVVQRLMSVDYQSIMLIDAENGNAVPFQQNSKDKNMEQILHLQREKGTGEKGLECLYALNLEDGRHQYRVIYSYLENERDVFLCAVQDVTDTYELEEKQKNELAQALTEAEAANHAKTAFLSRISHDMRTPLNGILGLTRLIKDSIIDDKITQDLTDLEMSGRYLLNLINDTLDMSRIESGKLELHPVVCEGRDMFNNAITLAKTSIRDKHINLQINVENVPFSMLYVDVDRIEQIILNIFGNAVKFTPDGGDIELTLKKISVQDGIITDKLTIRDTGIGISDEFLPHIFEAFSQEDISRTSSHQGTGLGMAITKQLLNQMGGDISVESELGRGTCFSMILKLQIATDEQIRTWRESQKHIGADGALSGKRVLLCEDHPLNTKIATFRLLL